MADFKWGLITSGPTFQALAGTLLRFENSSVKQFTRPGTDGSIDAFLTNGSTVFQFKFHQQNTSSKVLSDAADEKFNIQKNQHSQIFSSYWEKSTTWILVTNIQLNPQLNDKWNKEIVPSFKEIGLDAKLYGIEELENLLIKHPDVAQQFFEGKNRSFSSLQEELEAAQRRQIQDHELDTIFVGRSLHLDAFKTFLDDPEKKILIVKGAGGLGKTRLLHELGRKILNDNWGYAYWTNVNTFQASNSWMQGIPSSEKSLILIDEPTSPQTIKILLEQIQIPSSPISKWKVVISLRSHDLSLTKILNDKRIENFRQEIELSRLTSNDLESIAFNLLSLAKLSDPKKELKKVAKGIAKASGGHPIWVVIAVRLLEERGHIFDLPKDDWNIATQYIEQTINQTPNELATIAQVGKLLTWIALFKEVRIDEQSVLKFLSKELDISSLAALENILNFLVKSRILEERGRIRRIRPEVLREHLLISNLIEIQNNQKLASPLANELIERILRDDWGEIIPIERLIESLNLVELIQRLSAEKVEILTPLVQELFSLAAKGSAKDQLVSLQLSKYFAYSRPKEFTEICKALRLSKPLPSIIKDEFWGESTLKHTDVVLEIPWTLLDAARFATNSEDRSAILNELFNLAKFERSSKSWQKVQNTGKCAHQVIEKLIFSGPGFLAPFDKEGFELANNKLIKLKNGSGIDEAEDHALTSLITPLISIEREHVIWEKNSVSFQRFLINPSSQVFKERKALLKILWSFLQSRIDKTVRILVLRLLKNKRVNLSDLVRIADFVSADWPSTSELREARGFWEWHLKYDKRPEFKKAAFKCEKYFLAKPNWEIFASIFQWKYDQNKETEVAAKQLVQSLLKEPTANSISNFVNEGLEFAGEDKFWHGAPIIAEEMSEHFDSLGNVQEFVKANIASTNRKHQLFASLIFAFRLKHFRENSDLNSQKRLIDLFSEDLKGPIQIQKFILDLYYRPTFRLIDPLNDVDLTFIETHLEQCLGVQEERESFLKIFPRFLTLGWERIKRTIDKCLEFLSPMELNSVIAGLIDGIHSRIHFSPKQVSISKKDLKWIFQKLYLVPDLEKCLNKVEWDFQQLIKKADFLLSPHEFLDFLKIRLKKGGMAGGSIEFKILPTSFDFFQFVRPFDSVSDDREKFEEVLNELFTLNNLDYPVGYHLPEWVVRLDPKGVVVPDKIIEELKNIKDFNDIKLIIRWSRYAAQYPEGSSSWRKIAIEVANLSSGIANQKERGRVLWSLASTAIETWSGIAGEFHPRWQNAVSEAQNELDQEPDPNLKEYFNLKLELAKKELDREKLRHIEENEDE